MQQRDCLLYTIIVHKNFMFVTYVSIAWRPVNYTSLSSKEGLNTLDGFLELEFITVN